MFGTVKLTKNNDPDKIYSGYGVVFDSRSLFFNPKLLRQNVIIFGVDNSSSQGSDDTSIKAGA